MKLSDLIIEHGPFVAGDVILASFASSLLNVADLNELREELIAARSNAVLEVGPDAPTVGTAALDQRIGAP